MNSTDIKAPIFVGLASIWFLYKTMKNKEPPQMSTPDLASYERNEKFCPEKKPTQAELDAMARDEQETDAKSKEAQDNGFISRVIAFWIGVWTWLPKMIYNFWLKIYDSLFGPDKPCPAGGDAQPEPESQPEPEVQPPQPEPTNVEISTPVPKQVPLNEQPALTPEPLEQQVTSAETPPSREQLQPQPEFNGGGRRKQDLLRKIKNLTRTLKSRSK
jgi:hypothetical protein